jgi:hypothetical protein
LATSFLDASATGEVQLRGDGDLQGLSFSGVVARGSLADVDIQLDSLEIEGQFGWFDGFELKVQGDLQTGAVNGVAVTAEIDARIDESHITVNSARVRATDFVASELRLAGSLSFALLKRLSSKG